MPNYQWPSTHLPAATLKSAIDLKPPRLQARSEMESGRARVRRRWTSGVWTTPAQWVWTHGQFELWKAIWMAPEALAAGANWCDMPLFSGEAIATAAVRVQEDWSARLRGVMWTVSAQLEIDGLVVLSRAAANARWPGAIP